MVTSALVSPLKASVHSSKYDKLPVHMDLNSRVAAVVSHSAGLAHGALQQQLTRTRIDYREAFMTAGTIQKRVLTTQQQEDAKVHTALRERLPALSAEMSLLREEHAVVTKQLHSPAVEPSSAAPKTGRRGAKRVEPTIVTEEDLEGLQQVNDELLYTSVRWGGLLQDMQTPVVSQDGLLYAYQDRMLELEAEKEGLLQRRVGLLEELAVSRGSSRPRSSPLHHSAVSDAAMQLAQRQHATSTTSPVLRNVWQQPPWLALELPPCTLRHDAFTDINDDVHEGSGNMKAATYLGQRVVLQTAAYDDEKLVPRMQRESAVLSCLTALNLSCIPALIAHGTLVYDTGQQQLFMATSHAQAHGLLSTETLKKLQGSIPDLDAWREQMAEAALQGDFELSDRLQAEWDSMQPEWEHYTAELAKTVSRAAFSALRQLHSMLLVHGDVQPAKVLVEFQEGGAVRVMLVDWHKAVPGAADIDIEEEVDNMKLAIRRLCENLHLSKSETKAVLLEGRAEYQRQSSRLMLELPAEVPAEEQT